jgi:hypothetical protein
METTVYRPMPVPPPTSNMNLLLLSLVCILSWGIVQGDHNVTVDDLSPQISYTSPGWSEASFPTFDYDGSHAFSLNRSSTATFNFTGVAIYYVAAGWPYTVNTQLTLDSGNPEVVYMVDPNHQGQVGDPPSSGYQVRWQRTGLTNTTHTLVASMWSGGTYVVVDALIYTVADASTTSTSSTESVTNGSPSSASSTTRASSSSVAVASTKSKSSTNTTIIGATLGAVVAVLVLVIAFLLCFRRRKRREALAAQGAGFRSPTPLTPQQPPSPSVGMSQYPYGNNPFAANAFDAGGFAVAARGTGPPPPFVPGPPLRINPNDSVRYAQPQDENVGFHPAMAGYPYGAADYDMGAMAMQFASGTDQYPQRHSYGQNTLSTVSSGSHYSSHGGPNSPSYNGHPNHDGQWSPNGLVQSPTGHVYGERLSTVLEGSQYSGATPKLENRSM